VVTWSACCRSAAACSGVPSEDVFAWMSQPTSLRAVFEHRLELIEIAGLEQCVEVVRQRLTLAGHGGDGNS
jgi:hypothetical protein